MPGGRSLSSVCPICPYVHDREQEVCEQLMVPSLHRTPSSSN